MSADCSAAYTAATSAHAAVHTAASAAQFACYIPSPSDRIVFYNADLDVCSAVCAAVCTVHTFVCVAVYTSDLGDRAASAALCFADHTADSAAVSTGYTHVCTDESAVFAAAVSAVTVHTPAAEMVIPLHNNNKIIYKSTYKCCLNQNGYGKK